MMALVGALIGLPMFFEVGLVLLMPVIILVARRSGLPLMRIAIPTLAGLSAMHGLVPPHPGPLVAISALGANLGLTLALGVLVAIPTVIIAGPLFSKFAAAGRRCRCRTCSSPPRTRARTSRTRPRPTFVAALVSILIPVVLMLASALADIVWAGSDPPCEVGHRLPRHAGHRPAHRRASRASSSSAAAARWTATPSRDTLEKSLPPIAGIIFIVGAGGGFKQVLINTGIGQVIADAVEGSALSVLFLAWVVAVLIRVATGSATVATVTAAGILAPVAADLTSPHVALMVLAIGAGSLFLSHVNDAGFWLVKGYLGTSIGQTLKTWTVMECLISVCGLVGVLLRQHRRSEPPYARSWTVRTRENTQMSRNDHRRSSAQQPVLVIMGVSGSGKSTVAGILAGQLGWDLEEGDDLHPAANVAKMHAGTPLTDEDRWPWLDTVSPTGSPTTPAPGSRHHHLLRAQADLPRPDARRQRGVRAPGRQQGHHRNGGSPPGIDHFMPTTLLDSQIATLEPPGPDENTLSSTSVASPPRRPPRSSPGSACAEPARRHWDPSSRRVVGAAALGAVERPSGSRLTDGRWRWSGRDARSPHWFRATARGPRAVCTGSEPVRSRRRARVLRGRGSRGSGR